MTKEEVTKQIIEAWEKANEPLHADLAALRQQVAVCVAALEWYGRAENYDLVSAVQSDHGERARQALAAVRAAGIDKSPKT